MWWYDLINDGDDRSEQEHNFGLLDSALGPKPAYAVLKAISPYLRDFHYEPTNSLQNDGIYQLAFSAGRERIMVAWASGRQREVSISASAMQNQNVRVLDTLDPDKGMANARQQWVCKEDHCSTPVMLTEFPKIIRLSPDA